MLLVTHDVSETVAMADRVLLVDLPRLRRRGSPRLAELETEVLDRVMRRTAPSQPVRLARQR